MTWDPTTNLLAVMLRHDTFAGRKKGGSGVSAHGCIMGRRKPSAGDIYLLGNVPYNHFVQNLSPKKHHGWGFSGVLGGHFGDSVGCVGF